MALVTARVSTAGRRARQVFSRRLQAAVLTVALVLGTAVPPGVAIAQEADQGREGIAAPDSTADPDFDPGGETELPFDVGAPDSNDESADDSAPVDTEPVEDPDAPPDLDLIAPDAIDGSQEATQPVEPTPPAEPVAPQTQPAPAPPAATTEPPPAASTPAPEHEKRATTRKPRRDRAHHRRAARVPVPVPPAAPMPTSPAPAPAEATATIETIAHAAPPAPSDRARPGQDSHTVQPGESLWTIASDLLDAGATDAQIASETNRLYRLNRDRIGDDPNMLIAGTVLRLR